VGCNLHKFCPWSGGNLCKIKRAGAKSDAMHGAGGAIYINFALGEVEIYVKSSALGQNLVQCMERGVQFT